MAKTFASIDVGTSKVSSIVANLGDGGTIQILGVGVVPSGGVHKGLVVNIDEAKEAIRESVMRAERTSGLRIESAYVGVTGRHISSLNSRGVVATTRSDKRVTADDLDRVLESARSITIPSDRRLLHVIPRHYTLDGQVAVKEPVGMHSFRLDVETHIVTVSAALVQNLIKSIRGVGVEIDNLVLSPLAAGETVLSADERNAGVILADIGAGTTDVAIFKEGCVWHSAILPVGGYQVTRDIAIGLGIPNELAEEMKRKYGNLMTTNDVRAEHSELDVGNRHTVSYRELNDIIRVRVEEVLQLVMMEIPRGEWDVLAPAGLVLTGGTANIPGIDLLAREVLDMQHVRVGVPGDITGIADTLHDPASATSVGLLFWGANHESDDKWRMEELRPGVIGTLKNSVLSARRFLRGR
ncbi:cell division protein FtsA [Dehalococcoidia bacterium]|nr:cell division protein FtsA [Dehalococcoidia bacterium]MCL0055958.1 cell division protein FtsA [Dehalococcoidia bacterium]MCL0059585.1 cell division protein FtsA [Dehalococcoidia bacterium]